MSNRQPHTRTTTARGYGTRHQRKRAELAKLVERGGVRCGRCGERITPGSEWALDHADVPRAHELGLYRGAAHKACNLRARNERIAALARLAEAHGLDVEVAPERSVGKWVRANW